MARGPRSQSPKPDGGRKGQQNDGSNGGNDGPSNGSTHTSQQHKRRRYFKVDVPAIPGDVYNAIATKIKQEKSTRVLQHEQKLKQIRTKLSDQKAKVEQARLRVQELEQSKEQGLQDIRKLCQEEHEKKVAELEAKIREKHKAELDKMEEEWRQKTQEECQLICEERAAERKRKFEEEEAKLQKEEDEKKEAAASAPRVLMSVGSMEEGEEIEDDKPLPKSQQLQKEADELTAALEKANENKTELIWLLKHIIKAEEKQKAAVASKQG